MSKEKEIVDLFNKEMDELVDDYAKRRIADLEAKLAESEEENRDLEDDHNKLIEQYNKQYNDLCQEINVHSSARERLVKKLKELEHQLAEKDKAYQELLNSIQIKDLSNINFIQVNEDIVRFSEGGVIYEYNKKENTIRKIIDKAHQDKISFAVEQLEKVKNRIESKVESVYKRLDDLNIKIVCESTSRQLSTYEEIVKEIDNQIKQLKEGK